MYRDRRAISARRGMLRPIWSHPECPTKEDIRDELRRSEVKAILPHSDFPVLEKRPLILALVPQTVGIRCAIISRMMTPTIERLLRDCDCGEIPRRNFLLSLAPLTAALRGMAQSKGRQNFISQIRTGSWSSFSIRAIDPQYRPLLHDRGQVRTRQSSQSAR